MDEYEPRHPHGSPYDRGHADSYYGRPFKAHYGGVGGDSGPRVEAGLTVEQLADYRRGYDWNEAYGDRKDWG